MSKLSNFKNINPIYQASSMIHRTVHVPYGAGIQTILYDPSLVDVDIKGYADLMDPLKDSIGIISTTA